MAQGNNQNQKRNSTFTNSWTTTYDGVMSSMSFKFIDDRGFIVLAPIHPNMIGKTPKAGEKVYDYDNAQSFWISPQMAIALKTGIQALLEQENAEVPEFHQIQVGSGADNQRNLTIYAPRSIRLTVKVKNVLSLITTFLKFKMYKMKNRLNLSMYYKLKISM